MSATAELDDDLVERVDEAIEGETGVPVEELSLEAKIEALLAGYSADGGRATVPPEVVDRLQQHERALQQIDAAVGTLYDALAEADAPDETGANSDESPEDGSEHPW